MSDEPTPDVPRAEDTAAQNPTARVYWRVARAGVIGLLIGAVVIIFGHLGH
jgi:hypothetical protein